MQPPQMLSDSEVGGEWGLREGVGRRFSFLPSACGALPGGLEGEAERGGEQLKLAMTQGRGELRGW